MSSAGHAETGVRKFIREFKGKASPFLRWAFPTVVLLTTIAAGVLAGCGGTPQEGQLSDEELQSASWQKIVESARGTTVYWTHWRGDPAINKYTDEYVARQMKELYGITLVTVGGQGPDIVNTTLLEKQAGTTEGKIDVVWINGETFNQMRSADLLFGPFTETLPNFALVDTADPIINYDFEKPIDGYECPWGNVQLSLIYNSQKISDPPRTIPALKEWIIAHPGKFTYDVSFTGVTFLKGLLYGLNGGPGPFQGGFDSATYAQRSTVLWEYLNAIKPYLWRNGETYPEDVAKMHSLFANGEIWFTMSNNDAEVDNKILQGVLPPYARGSVLEEGTIANTHYQAIPFNAPNKAGALVLINFLISPEAQFEKLKPEVWADGTVLDVERLPAEWQAKFAAVPGRKAAMPRAEIRKYAVPEVNARYHERILEDWRTQVLKK